MIEKIKVAALKMILNKYALGYLVKGWSKIKGYKTQILLVIGIALKVLELIGYVPQGSVGDEVYALLLGAAGVTFMQKLQRYQPVINDLVGKVQKQEA